MARFITEFSGDAPDIPMLKTLSLDLTHKPGEEYGGLPVEFFKAERFPWLNLAKMNVNNEVPDESKGQYVVDLQEPSLGTTECFVFPAESGRQRVINRESIYYVSRYEQRNPDNNIPPLLFIDTDNSLTFRTMRPPEEFKDKALGNLDAYEIVSYDKSTRTIRVKGLTYDRTEPTSDGVYARGKHMGLNSFLRDVLESDDHERDLEWKFQKHAYGIARLTSTNTQVKYDRIVDETFPDPRGDNLAPTFHNIRLMEDPPSDPVAGQSIQLLRRMSFITPAATTAHTFSQKYWMLEVDIQMSKSVWQFFALFGWSMYQETIDGIRFEEDVKTREIDIVEIPAGDKRWRFHNAHAPQGGQFNLAQVEGRQALMPEHGDEWDSDTSQQHQLAADLGPDYTSGRAKFRQYWYPPGNPAGKPANSLEWYVEVDGVFKRIGGCLAPAFWAGDILTTSQILFSAAAHGDFARVLANVFSTPSQNPDIRDYVNKIYSLEVFQFEGQMAGGSGAPGLSGKIVRSLGPTPGDVSGGSGTGIVQVDGSGDVTPGNPTGPSNPVAVPGVPLTEFEAAIDVIIIGTKLMIPQVGRSYRMSARLTRNTSGYGVQFDWAVNDQSGFEATVVEDTGDGEHATLTFTGVPETLAGETVSLGSLVTVTAIQTTGPGTAPIIRGAAVRESSQTAAPDSGPSPITSGSSLNPSISVTDRGPTVSGSVIDIEEGQQLRIQTGSGRVFLATVNAAGNYAFDNFGSEFNGESLTVLYDQGTVGTIQSASFIYVNPPVVVEGVQVIRWEARNVVDGALTLFLGLSSNAPARVMYGTSEDALNQSAVISRDDSQGLDNGVPHIYGINGLAPGTRYFFRAEDHINGAYMTGIISGVPN